MHWQEMRSAGTLVQVPGLAPHAKRLEALIHQLRECLLAFAGLVRGHTSVSRWVQGWGAWSA